MTKKLYAVRNNDGPDVVFNTSGWTTDREVLYDAVSAKIDMEKLHELLDYDALSIGIEIGTAEKVDDEWKVEIDDWIANESGYDA